MDTRFDNKLKAYMEVMKFILLINVKMATIVGILTFISMRTTTTKLSLVEHEKSCITAVHPVEP